MSGGTGLAAALALAAGLAGSVQAAVMGRFGERVGSVEALAWAFLLSVVIAFAALLVARRGFGNLGGGVVGAEVALAGSHPRDVHRLHDHARLAAHRHDRDNRVARRGTARRRGAIDRFGLFGFERIALGWPRALGIALLAAGAALTLRR